MDNNNEPPVQQNNQSLETQVASLTQQVALLTQLLLQQQSNQQQAGASSTIIQSEQISSSSLTPPPQVTPKTEQKSPARETRVCKECQDTEKPLYRHYELCKQCHNRSSKKRRRDEIQNDNDRFVNHCHQAAEIPRRIRRSMEEPAEVDQTNQADLEERHRQAVTSGESDESDEEQKYPMTEEKFKKFYGAPTEAAYNSRGIEICVDCAKPEIAVASSHRCRKCHSRYVEERYRCNPKNYKTSVVILQVQQLIELPNCQDSNDSGGSEYEETDSNESEESSGSEFDGSDESEYDGSAQSESRNSNNFASPTPRKLNKHHGNFKPTVRHTPMSQEEFDRVFVNATFESRFNSHGKRICLDCNSKSIKSLSRCLKCLARYNLERRRADPQHYRLCPMCKEVCWHQSMSIAQCAKCYQWLCEQNINNTVRATRHSENLNNTASAT
ncbi:hypothetical protein M3Y97_00676700 [Aphelenchoides bicaudatus]|nr:hypothetical protein M3Y97_00676700 [Aphelenchoides bicaudatus]